jgi:hypothetical protein
LKFSKIKTDGNPIISNDIQFQFFKLKQELGLEILFDGSLYDGTQIQQFYDSFLNFAHEAVVAEKKCIKKSKDTGI